MKYSALPIAIFAASLTPASAAPSAANPFHLKTPVCGPSNSTGNGICVDHGAITSKPHATYQDANKHYLFRECTAACHASSQCKSIVYYNTDDYAGLNWNCELLSEPVTPYTIKCGDSKYGAGATPFAQNNSAIGDVFNPASLNTSALSNYFEKSCAEAALPQMKTYGDIPSADGDQLLCGVWTTTQQSYADLYGRLPNNTQTQCRDSCLKDSKCKSYWWFNYANPTSQGFGQTQQMHEPEIMGDCAFFSQPVKEHAMFSEYPLTIYDVNCKIGNGSFF